MSSRWVAVSSAAVRVARRNLFAGCICLLSLCLTASAQNVAEISGTVTDQSGAAIVGAVVKLTQADTAYTRAALTEANGSYAALNLPIGPYTLEVEQAGFSPYKQIGIVLDVNTNPKINVVLTLGNVASAVTVEAGSALVETVTNAVGQVMDSQSVVDLPLNGRQVTDLLLLSAGAVSAGNVGNRQFPITPIAIAGAGAGNNLFVLDGASHNDPATNMNMPVPFPDALQEFKVEDSTLPARFGQHASAAVSLVTKSGTNQFHWSGFEFVRNRDFNARNSFALTRDPQKRNQFGGTFGGPIRKNKLFVFLAYQGTILKTDPTTKISYTPTAAMLAGNFTQVASAACNSGKTLTLKTPVGTNIAITNDQVNPADFDPVSMNYLKYIPVSTDPCGKVQYGYPTPSTEHELLGKMDFQKSDRHSIFARYYFPKLTAPAYYDGVNALTTPSVGVINRLHTLAGGDTLTINSNIINTLRGVFIAENNTRNPIPFVSPSQEGANITTTDRATAFTSLSITGGFSLGGSSNNPSEFDYTNVEVADTVDIVKGAHQIAFGADFIHSNTVYFNTQYSNGQFSFDGSQSGLGLLDFMLGRISTSQQSPDGLRHDRGQYIGLFAQDTWKVTQHLTLNVGLRWDPSYPLHNQDYAGNGPADVLQFLPANFTAGKVSSVFTNAPAGLIFPGDAQYTDGNALNSRHLMNFAPRVGVVFDPRGKGKETIRAGYGVYFDSPPMLDYAFVDTEAPWGPLIQLNSVQFSNPYANYPGGNPFPIKLTTASIFPTQALYVEERQHTQPTYSQQWNVSLQKQFFSNLLVTVSYLGNKITHIWESIDINPASYVPGTCAAGQYGLTATGNCSTTANTNQRRQLYLQNPAIGQNFSAFLQDNESGNGSYNALVGIVQKRLSNNFSVLGNYTWSKCIDDADPTGPSPGLQNSSQYSNPLVGPGFDRGRCGTDRRQILNVSGSLVSPTFSNHWIERIAGHWQVSPILQASTGAPLNITPGKDTALNGTSGGQRANLIGDPYLSNPTAAAWFSTAAFATPAAGTYGNLGRNVLSGPGSFVINLALSRRFAIRDRDTIELRAEAFNLLNTVNLSNPSTSSSTSAFGTITAAGDPRIMQFAVKYSH